jgi:hypothetical protein
MSSKKALRTISKNGVLGFNFLTGSGDGLTEMRFNDEVMNPGSDGVVISRTRVGYW